MTEFYCGFIGFYRVLLFVFVVVVLCFNVLATDAAARRRRRHFLKRSRSDCFFERAAICGHRMVCFCFLFFVFVFFCIFFFFFIFFFAFIFLNSPTIPFRPLSSFLFIYFLFVFKSIPIAIFLDVLVSCYLQPSPTHFLTHSRPAKPIFTRFDPT